MYRRSPLTSYKKRSLRQLALRGRCGLQLRRGWAQMKTVFFMSGYINRKYFSFSD